MASKDPKVVMKQMDPKLRKEFFCRWPELKSLNWSQLTKKRSIDPLVAAITQLGDSEKREIVRLLANFVTLKSENGIRILLEECDRRNPAARASIGEVNGKLDKIVYSYLHEPLVFQNALVAAEADRFTNRRGWNTWPPVSSGTLCTDTAAKERLGQRLIEYHAAEVRGDCCEINDYISSDGAVYIHAYLPDWFDNHMVFSETGDVDSLKFPLAFSILFVYTPRTGEFAMICEGGAKKQRELRLIFFETMLGLKVDNIPPEFNAFRLDRVLGNGFAFDKHGVVGVRSVEVTSMAWASKNEKAGLKWVGVRFSDKLDWNRRLEQLDRLLAAYDHTRNQIEVVSLDLRFEFHDSKHRSLTIRLSPRTCNIRSDDDELRRDMCDQCVTAWGFRNG